VGRVRCRADGHGRRFASLQSRRSRAAFGCALLARHRVDGRKLRVGKRRGHGRRRLAIGWRRHRVETWRRGSFAAVGCGKESGCTQPIPLFSIGKREMRLRFLLAKHCPRWPVRWDDTWWRRAVLAHPSERLVAQDVSAGIGNALHEFARDMLSQGRSLYYLREHRFHL